MRSSGLFRALLIVAGLIVYGTLYPWHFTPRQLEANPVWILLHAWTLPTPRRLVFDVLINIGLYAPLGFCAYLAAGGMRRRFVAIVAAAAIGGTLSAILEIAQLYDQNRVSSAIDFTTNSLGALTGALVALATETPLRRWMQTRHRRERPDLAAVAVLVCWVAYSLFPGIPRTSLSELKQPILAFFLVPQPIIITLASAALSWMAAGMAIAALRLRRPGLWLGIALAMIPAQFVILTRSPNVVQFGSAVAGTIAFGLLYRKRGYLPALAGSFVLLLVLRGLAPFTISDQAIPFDWIPFSPLLQSDWQNAAQTLLDKMFYYGMAIWLLRRASLPLPVAGALVASVLMGTEVAQTHLQGRTPDITDPVLAVLLAVLMPPSRAEKE